MSIQSGSHAWLARIRRARLISRGYVGLCKLLHFKPIPEERQRTITLEPPAVLTGRLVSPDGETPK